MCSQPAHLFAVGVPLTAHTQPAVRTGLVTPALEPLFHVYREVFLVVQRGNLHTGNFAPLRAEQAALDHLLGLYLFIRNEEGCLYIPISPFVVGRTGGYTI